jgi:two-component system, NtrC family, response regulator AlgB
LQGQEKKRQEAAKSAKIMKRGARRQDDKKVDSMTDDAAAWSALVVDDDAGVRQSIRLCLETDGARVLGVATASGALEALERSRFDIVLLDLWLGQESGLSILSEILRREPNASIIVITAYASFETAVQAMKLGAADYLPKPFTAEQVRMAVRRVLESSRMRQRLTELEEQLDEASGDTFFESTSPTYTNFLKTAARVAAADCVVLLRGESGTGKNILARWLRAHSTRAGAPFVSVNCPALSGDLMISALFGHKKGAFTGAVADAPGKVQQAESGTVFLDEVGDLTPEVQARLLRFLNDRSYERLGDPKERTANVRIIAATNRSIEQDAKSGRFREDLLFRLNVVTLTLPSLRDRAEDVLPLARHYLTFFEGRQRRHERTFSPEAEHAMVSYPWPGNLRELRNAVERGTILTPSNLIEPEDLGIPRAPNVVEAGVARSGPAVLGGDVSIETLEREHIARVLARASSLESAARILEIDSTTLQRKRKRYGLA